MPTRGIRIAKHRLRLLTVHPHPDDESIACGGVLARYAAEGIYVHVVTCTGGEEGENLAGIDLGEQTIPHHRQRELADALGILGVSGHTDLGYRDSGMAGSEANEHPDSFHRADLEEAAGRLAAVVREVQPQVVISDDAQGTYGHPDHIKAHRATVRAVALAADPDAGLSGTPWRVAKRYVHTMDRDRILTAHRELRRRGRQSPFGDESLDTAEDVPFGVSTEQITTRVPVVEWLATKQEAMRAHRSQLGEDSFFFNLAEELTTELFGVEDFVLEDVDREQLAGGALPREREQDLFAGLRVSSRATAAPVDGAL